MRSYVEIKSIRSCSPCCPFLWLGQRWRACRSYVKKEKLPDSEFEFINADQRALIARLAIELSYPFHKSKRGNKKINRKHKRVKAVRRTSELKPTRSSRNVNSFSRKMDRNTVRCSRCSETDVATLCVWTELSDYVISAVK